MSDHTPPAFAPLGEQDLNNRFNYHQPSAQRGAVHEEARTALHMAAMTLVALCPPGRELSLAITHLEDSMFWANAAIARTSQ